MIWNGKELNKYGEICDALILLQTEEEAQKFLTAAREDMGEHTEGNIGYLLGYLSREDHQRLYGLLKTPHPIMGTNFMMPAEDLLQAGMTVASVTPTIEAVRKYLEREYPTTEVSVEVDPADPSQAIVRLKPPKPVKFTTIPMDLGADLDD